MHFNKTDESFNPAATERYDLCLQVSAKEISYSILETGRTKYLGVGTFRLPLEGILEEHPWLKGRFNSTRIIIENNRSTLVPAAFFHPGEEEKYLSFTVEHDNQDTILADLMAPLDLYSVYSVPGALLSKLQSLFPAAPVRHISTALIEAVWGNYKNLLVDKRVFIHVRKENFDLLVFDGKQLNYFNAFPFVIPEDLAYYVIFVFEQLGLNPEENLLVLLGNVEKNSPVYEILYKYVRNIEMGGRNENYTYSYVFRDVPGNAFYPLLNPGS